MNIKLVAIDLDGTTLDTHGRLSDTNRQAILSAIANGVHVCIASGRSFYTLPEDILAVPEIEYAITGNGVSVYRIDGAKKLHSLLMTPDSIDGILRITENDPISYEGFIDGRAFTSQDVIDHPDNFGVTEWALSYIKATREIVPDIRAFLSEHKHHLDSMCIVVKDQNLKHDIWSRIQKGCDDVYLTCSLNRLIEISYKDCGKKSGVKFLAEYLGILPENVAALGDGDNDLDMLEYAGIGIAMENASELLKSKADYITLHHDQDGLAYAFREILHII